MLIVHFQVITVIYMYLYGVTNFGIFLMIKKDVLKSFSYNEACPEQRVK